VSYWHNRRTATLFDFHIRRRAYFSPGALIVNESIMMRSFSVSVFSLLALSLFFTIAPQHVEAERLFSSGCEFQGDMTTSPQMLDTGPDGQIPKEWQKLPTQWGNNSPSSLHNSEITTSVKRSGLSSCRTAATDQFKGFWHKFTPASNTTGTWYLRFYVYIASYPTTETDIANFSNETGESPRQSLILTPSGVLKLRAYYGGAVIGTSPVSIPLNEWHMVEWMYSVTTGSTPPANAEVRLDGVRVIQGLAATASNPGGFNIGLGYMMDAYPATLYFDDIALNDNIGKFQNSWPGSGSIVHLQPNAPGDYSDCNGFNYSHIDEVTPNDDTDVCNLSTGGDIVDVNVESPVSAGLDPSARITLVQVGDRHRLTGSVSTNYNLRIKSRAGGDFKDGYTVLENDTVWNTNGDVGPTNDWFSTPSNYSLTSYHDPETGCPWTMFGTNSLENMQIGALHQVGSNQDVLISTLWALVEYHHGFVEPCSSPTSGNLYTPITVDSGSPTSIQTKSGGFWAKAIAADAICLGSSTNCTTTWKPPAKCRLEHHRVVARPNATSFPTWNLPDFSVNIATNLCDAMLDQPSKDAGWVATGYDVSNRVLGGVSHSPRACYFARLVCDTNVAIGVTASVDYDYAAAVSAGFVQ
jgi:hypothetical protein